MLYFDGIGVSEGTDVNKKRISKGYVIYNYFLDKGIKLKPEMYNGCHNALMMFANFDNMAILSINGVSYRCIINQIIKFKAIIYCKIPI